MRAKAVSAVTQRDVRVSATARSARMEPRLESLQAQIAALQSELRHTQQALRGYESHAPGLEVRTTAIIA